MSDKDAVIRFLFGLLDDVDTHDDAAKDDDKGCRRAMAKTSQRRWETGITSDGYTLDLSKMRAPGVKVSPVTRLPDGSAFATASWALPGDHWLYQETPRVPPMPFRVGEGRRRQELAEKVRAAAMYAVKAATRDGKDSDFDPDAMVQNFVVGMLGYCTDDGLSKLDPGHNPDPVPPLFGDVLRRVFMATPSSIDRPDHHPEGLWAALGYDVEANQWDNTDCDMERLRVPVEALLRDVNAALGCSLPLPPYVPCEDVDDEDPCDRCKKVAT